MSEISILGIIPARGGSKGVPQKNTRDLAGYSLVERAFYTANQSRVLNRLILSSDDQKAIDISQKIGLEVPFIRPSQLATDNTPMLDVVLHALDNLDPDQTKYQAVLLLQPTSPLRQAEHLRRAVDILIKESASSVCSVASVPLDLCPHYLMRVDKNGYLGPFMNDGMKYTRRQDVPRAYRRCGTVFLTRTAVLREDRNFYGNQCVPMILPAEETLNIDTVEDWQAAEQEISKDRGLRYVS